MLRAALIAATAVFAGVALGGTGQLCDENPVRIVTVIAHEFQYGS